MLLNLLANAVDKTRDVQIGEAALYALLGFLVVILGIAFLIFVVWAIGKVMAKANFSKAPKKQRKSSTAKGAGELGCRGREELSEEVVAVITAAIMAYYEKTNPKCEFTVKRIKRI